MVSRLISMRPISARHYAISSVDFSWSPHIGWLERLGSRELLVAGLCFRRFNLRLFSRLWWGQQIRRHKSIKFRNRASPRPPSWRSWAVEVISEICHEAIIALIIWRSAFFINKLRPLLFTILWRHASFKDYRDISYFLRHWICLTFQ